MELLVTGVVAIVIVAVAIGAFLLGKRAERKSTPSADYQIQAFKINKRGFSIL